jgi:hypothetical protein
MRNMRQRGEDRLKEHRCWNRSAGTVHKFYDGEQGEEAHRVTCQADPIQGLRVTKRSTPITKIAKALSLTFWQILRADVKTLTETLSAVLHIDKPGRTANDLQRRSHLPPAVER